MPTIAEKARYVRSKNAGPFWVTMDIFAQSENEFTQIASSPKLTKACVARIFNTKAEDVKIFSLPSLNVIKISVPRRIPQGDKYERDMHSGQQYIPLLDMEL